MTIHAILPATLDPAGYWEGFVANFGRTLEAAGVRVEYAGHEGDDVTGIGLFRFTLDGKPAIFDYSDHALCRPCLRPEDRNVPLFKCTYTVAGTAADRLWTFPFAPRTFPDWDQYARMAPAIRYDVSGDRILYKQRLFPCRPCFERRKRVETLLTEAFGDRVDHRMLPLEDYWRQINTALVRVFAPGTEPDRLDRGQAQYMAFGCCTISPKLSTVLPWFETLAGGIQYVVCKDDFSDLPVLIRALDEDREWALRVGREAKALFARTMAPGRLLEWLKLCLADT